MTCRRQPDGRGQSSTGRDGWSRRESAAISLSDKPQNCPEENGKTKIGRREIREELPTGRTQRVDPYPDGEEEDHIVMPHNGEQ